MRLALRILGIIALPALCVGYISLFHSTWLGVFTVIMILLFEPVGFVPRWIRLIRNTVKLIKTA